MKNPFYIDIEDNNNIMTIEYKKLTPKEQFNRRFHHLNKDIKHLYSTNEVYSDIEPVGTNLGVIKSRFKDFLVKNDLIPKDYYDNDFDNDDSKKEKESEIFIRLWKFFKTISKDKLTLEQQESYKTLLNNVYLKCLLKQNKQVIKKK